MKNQHAGPSGPAFHKMLDEQLKKSELIANGEAKFVSKQMMGLDRYGKKQLLRSMSTQLAGHPLIGFIFKLLIDHATANEDYEVCAAVQEVANEIKIEMADIGTIMKKMMEENPGQNLFIDPPR